MTGPRLVGPGFNARIGGSQRASAARPRAPGCGHAARAGERTAWMQGAGRARGEADPAAQQKWSSGGTSRGPLGLLARMGGRGGRAARRARPSEPTPPGLVQRARGRRHGARARRHAGSAAARRGAAQRGASTQPTGGKAPWIEKGGGPKVASAGREIRRGAGCGRGAGQARPSLSSGTRGAQGRGPLAFQGQPWRRGPARRPMPC
jgi:hypothetical protein